MTLISRDLMSPSTPYEAELRERLAAAEQKTLFYQRIALLQDAVVTAARDTAELASYSGSQSLAAALFAFDRAVGTVLLESMPAELRESLTGPSALEEGLKAQSEPLFAGAPEPAPSTPSGPDAKPLLDIDGLARDLANAGPLEVEQLAGQGWPAGWADYTGISDQEVVWPVQPKGEPVPGGTPVAAFASHTEQALYARLRNAAPLLLAIVRAAEALRGTSVPHYGWCRKTAYDNGCTCDATATNEKLDALRAALAGGGG